MEIIDEEMTIADTTGLDELDRNGKIVEAMVKEIIKAGGTLPIHDIDFVGLRFNIKCVEKEKYVVRLIRK